MDPSVSAARNRFEEPRVLRVVTEHCTQALDRGIQAVLEIDKGSVRPELASQFFAFNDLSRTFEQHSQDLQRLPVQRHAGVSTSQFPHADVEEHRFPLNRRPLCNRGGCFRAHRYDKRY